MGAKNHTSILPDANKNHAVNRFELTLAPGVVTFLGLIPPQHLAHSVVGAAFGAAGQRCMALSVAVMVGETTAAVLIVAMSVEDTGPVRVCVCPDACGCAFAW